MFFRDFILVLILAVFGFGIAFMGLFPTIETFYYTKGTAYNLFDASLGTYLVDPGIINKHAVIHATICIFVFFL